MAFLVLPMFDKFDIDTRKVVGVLKSVFHWKSYLQSILPDNDNTTIVVLDNVCDESYTYEINGKEAYGVGPGDLHDRAFDYMEENVAITLTVSPRWYRDRNPIESRRLPLQHACVSIAEVL